MTCGKCGTKNPKEAEFCTNCGEVFAKPNNQPGAPDPAIKRKRLIIAGGVAAAVILVVVLIVTIFGGNKAEKAAEDLYEAVVDMDPKAVMEMLPPAVLSYMTDTLDFADSTFEIDDSKKLDDDRVEEIDELYGTTFGTEEGYIQAATIVFVEVSYHGEDISRDEIPLVMVKVDGDWYLDVLTTSEEIGEADFTYDFSEIKSVIDVLP